MFWVVSDSHSIPFLAPLQPLPPGWVLCIVLGRRRWGGWGWQTGLDALHNLRHHCAIYSPRELNDQTGKGETCSFCLELRSAVSEQMLNKKPDQQRTLELGLEWEGLRLKGWGESPGRKS